MGHQNAGILQRIALRDQTAFQDCIVRYGPLIWNVARSLTRTAADAEDATQEIFLAIWQNAARFNPILGSEIGFVALLSRRRLVDGIRRQYARPITESLTGEDGETLEFASIPSTVDESCDGDRAIEALRNLEPGYRKVLMMTVMQGLTQSEIAIQLNMPIGTVKSSIRRGLLLIRAALLPPAVCRKAHSITTGVPTMRRSVHPRIRRFSSTLVRAADLS